MQQSKHIAIEVVLWRVIETAYEDGESWALDYNTKLEASCALAAAYEKGNTATMRRIVKVY